MSKETSTKHINRYWEKTGGDDPLLGHGNFQHLFDSIQDRFRAVSFGDRILRCMDEGIIGGGVRLAGSGILYEKVGKDFRGHVRGVYSHEGCGAAGVLAAQRDISTEDTDIIGDEAARRIAKVIGVPYYGRIPAHKMRRPKELHDARAVYYVGSDSFDPQSINLPSGFVINRKPIRDSAYPLSEAELAVSIAQGTHGFGEKFTEDTPFYMVAVSDSKPGSIPFHRLRDELSSVARPLKAVVVDAIEIIG